MIRRYFFNGVYLKIINLSIATAQILLLTKAFDGEVYVKITALYFLINSIVNYFVSILYLSKFYEQIENKENIEEYSFLPILLLVILLWSTLALLYELDFHILIVIFPMIISNYFVQYLDLKIIYIDSVSSPEVKKFEILRIFARFLWFVASLFYVYLFISTAEYLDKEYDKGYIFYLLLMCISILLLVYKRGVIIPIFFRPFTTYKKSITVGNFFWLAPRFFLVLGDFSSAVLSLTFVQSIGMGASQLVNMFYGRLMAYFSVVEPKKYFLSWCSFSIFSIFLVFYLVSPDYFLELVLACAYAFLGVFQSASRAQLVSRKGNQKASEIYLMSSLIIIFPVVFVSYFLGSVELIVLFVLLGLLLRIYKYEKCVIAK